MNAFEVKICHLKKSDQRVASISHACSRLLISEAAAGPKASTLVPLSLSLSPPPLPPLSLYLSRNC